MTVPQFAPFGSTVANTKTANIISENLKTVFPSFERDGCEIIPKTKCPGVSVTVKNELCVSQPSKAVASVHQVVKLQTIKVTPEPVSTFDSSHSAPSGLGFINSKFINPWSANSAFECIEFVNSESENIKIVSAEPLLPGRLRSSHPLHPYHFPR